MRYGRHLRHRRHSRHERHGDSIASWLNGPLSASVLETKTLVTPAALSIAGTVKGGFAPYTYVWKKGSTAVSGQTASTLSIATTATTDSGSYTLEATDSKGTKVVSNACVVTITAAP